MPGAFVFANESNALTYIWDLPTFATVTHALLVGLLTVGLFGESTMKRACPQTLVIIVLDNNKSGVYKRKLTLAQWTRAPKLFFKI